MRPGSPSPSQVPSKRLPRLAEGAAASQLALCLVPLPSWAQDGQAPGVAGADEPDDIGRQREGLEGPVGEVPGDEAEGPREVAFESDAVSYNSDTDVVPSEMPPLAK